MVTLSRSDRLRTNSLLRVRGRFPRPRQRKQLQGYFILFCAVCYAVHFFRKTDNNETRSKKADSSILTSTRAFQEDSYAKSSTGRGVNHQTDPVQATFVDALGEDVKITIEKPIIHQGKVLGKDTIDFEELKTPGTHYKFPPGKIFPLKKALKLWDLRDIVLDGQGSTLLFSNPANGGVELGEAERVSLRNFRFAFDDLSGALPLFSNATVDGDGKIRTSHDRHPSLPLYTVSTRTENDLWGWDKESNYEEKYLADIHATIQTPYPDNPSRGLSGRFRDKCSARETSLQVLW